MKKRQPDRDAERQDQKCVQPRGPRPDRCVMGTKCAQASACLVRLGHSRIITRYSPDCRALEKMFHTIEACCNENRLVTDCACSQVAGLAAPKSCKAVLRLQ